MRIKKSASYERAVVVNDRFIAFFKTFVHSPNLLRFVYDVFIFLIFLARSYHRSRALCSPAFLLPFFCLS